MNLKKAFQYQKALKVLESRVVDTMLNTENYIQITETRLKSEINKMNSEYEFEDEVKDLSSNKFGKYDLNKVIIVLNSLIKWRTELAKGIAQAKAQTQIGPEKLNYDAALVYANDCRDQLWRYGYLAELENDENEKTGSLTVVTDMGSATVGYTINTTKTIAAEVIKAAADEKLTKEAELEALSDEIEAASLGTNIAKEFTPPIPLNITAEDLYSNIERYI